MKIAFEWFLFLVPLVIAAWIGHLLFNRKRESRNPLDWCGVDRCLLLIGVFFSLIFMFYSLNSIVQILSVDSIPYINAAFYGYFFGFVAYFIDAFWAVLLMVGLWLRSRDPENPIFIHAVVQFSAVHTIIICFILGPVTNPGPLLTAMALGAFIIILFKPNFALPWIGTVCLLLIASMAATDFDLVPYAPFFSGTPLVDGKIDAFFWISTLAVGLAIFLMMLFLISFIVIRWRDREVKVEMYSAALRDELEKGRKIQRDFLPNQIPTLPGCEIAAYFHPALQLSGDFYDAFKLPGNRVSLVIADISDKGVGSALFMALLRSLIRVFSGYPELHESSLTHSEERVIDLKDSKRLDGSTDVDVLNAVSLANDYVVQEHGEEGMFATLFFGVFDAETGSLTYINCGHEPLIIAGRNGIKEKLRPTGPALGLFPGAHFEIMKARLEPGDILLGYTDGVTEAQSSNDELFTRRRLEQVIERSERSSAAELLEDIKTELFRFTDQAPQNDDITMFAVLKQ
jgi:serine phosphatase RsbU (regulator of sigma subunit)